jgi:hypothetical protein
VKEKDPLSKYLLEVICVLCLKFKVLIPILGVNAISGVSTRSLEPPKFGAEKDYVVIGHQPWLDGIVSGPGIVRQVSKVSLHIKGVFV